MKTTFIMEEIKSGLKLLGEEYQGVVRQQLQRLLCMKIEKMIAI